MPTAERYARYREAQTTIWVSKTASAFLSRERTEAREGTAAVLDRLITELRRLRRSAPGAEAARETPARAAGTRTAAAKRPAAAAKRPAARGAARGTATRGTATRGTAKRGAAKRGTRTATRRSA
jgi:hypothetical protein